MGSDLCEGCISLDGELCRFLYDQLLLIVCNCILEIDAWMVRHNSAF